MQTQHPTSASTPPRKTINPLRPGLALFLLVCGCCMPLSQAFLPSHSSQGARRTRSLLGLGPSSPSPWSSLPLGRKAGGPLHSMLDKGGGNKRRRPRRQGNGNESDDEEEEEEEGEYRAMRPAALDRVRPPPPPRVRPEVGKNRLPFGVSWIPQGLSAALLMGTFVLGVGTGVTVDSAINTNPKDLASRDAIDKNAPNPKFCQRYGASTLVLDNRFFVSFNPFDVYVTQADVKPGCVLRAANVVQALQGRGLLTDEEVNVCKNGNNTWAYVGDINDKPQLSCVYQSDDAQNEFLEKNPKLGVGEDVYDK